MRGVVFSVVLVAICIGCGGGRRPMPMPPPAPRTTTTAPTPTSPPRAQSESVPEPAPADRVEQGKPSPLRDKTQATEKVSTRASVEDFEARTYKALGGRLLYQLFKPANYDPKRKYPLILVLHGASSRGTDNHSQLANSNGPLYWASDAVQNLQEAFVVAPQSDPQYAPTWVRAWRRPARPNPKRPEPLEQAVRLVGELSGEFSLDKDRLYLVGFSMGGFGAWIGASRHPDLFAAAVPIAGGGDPTHIAGTSAKVWAFHGITDKTVPIRRSRQMIDALKKAGATPRFTEYPGVGHEVWRLVYEEPELPQWLFQQSR